MNSFLTQKFYNDLTTGINELQENNWSWISQSIPCPEPKGRCAPELGMDATLRDATRIIIES